MAVLPHFEGIFCYDCSGCLYFVKVNAMVSIVSRLWAGHGKAESYLSKNDADFLYFIKGLPK